MIKKIYCIAGMMILMCSTLIAQTDKSYILERTNVEALNKMAAHLSEEYNQKHTEAIRIANEKGWPMEGLQYIDERGLPVYYTIENNDAAAMTQTIQLRNDLGVYGQGMEIGEWDGGHARISHQDLSGRVTIMDSPYDIESHGTHVAGTLIGNGFGDSDARGMAPMASLDGYDWDNDLAELYTAAAAGLLISNHSYGTTAGWNKEDGTVCAGFRKKWTWHGGSDEFNVNGEDPKFGQYNWKARAIDTLCVGAPCLLPVKSSGNDHNDAPVDDICSDDVRDGLSGSWVSYDEDIHPSGDGTHGSSISSWGNAKNILTVGNLQDNDWLLLINESSSRGMTDDGRIKPDICGVGTNVYSTDSDADDDYSEKTGTSMASPNVAGSLLLLQQLYEQKNGGSVEPYMRSATLKGLVIHTATDLGNPGPDFTYGWGLLNASKAGHIINRESYGLDYKILEEDDPIGYSFTFFKEGPVKVTLCYTDEADASTSGQNDNTPRLVNDLDMTLVQTGGSTYYPYVMDMNNPTANATTGDNDRDNVEQIDPDNATDGEYTVYIDVEGPLTGEQPFSLIISGVFRECGGNTLDLGNNIILPGVYNDYEILCQGTIETGTEVKFVAGGNIKLEAGFNAEPGSEFNAVVLDCD